MVEQKLTYIGKPLLYYRLGTLYSSSWDILYNIYINCFFYVMRLFIQAIKNGSISDI